MKAFGNLITLCMGARVVTGCAGSLASRTQKLELGMTKDRVIRTMGGGHVTVAAREDEASRRTEVLRFEDAKTGEVLVYLRDGKLVQWGDVRVLESMPH
jgi:hypothetical protein